MRLSLKKFLVQPSICHPCMQIHVLSSKYRQTINKASTHIISNTCKLGIDNDKKQRNNFYSFDNACQKSKLFIVFQ